MLGWARPRHRGDGGAVAVEAAIITPVLLLIVFGIIEFTLLLKDNLAVSSSVRAGARTGSSLPRFENATTDFAKEAADQVARSSAALEMDKAGVELWVYDAEPNGLPPSGSFSAGSCNTRCVRFTFTYDNAKRQYVAVRSGGGGWAASTINACPGDPGQDSIGAFLRYPHGFVTGLFGAEVTLSDKSVMVFEPYVPKIQGEGCKP